MKNTDYIQQLKKFLIATGNSITEFKKNILYIKKEDKKICGHIQYGGVFFTGEGKNKKQILQIISKKFFDIFITQLI